MVASLSLALFAGCATERNVYDVSERPANLLEQRADTYRGARTGLDSYASRDTVSVLPAPTVIHEAAGARRPE
jgi:hypothetical protein